MINHGFSLIEALIVVAMVGILAAVGLSSYARWRASSTVLEAAQQFAQAVTTTRTGAKRTNTCWQIRLSAPLSGATSYEISRFPHHTCSGTPTQEQTYALPQGTMIRLTGAASAGTNNVNFTPPYATTDPAPNTYVAQWRAKPSIQRTVRVTSILGKVVVK
ncbi:type II secretion system protein [Deinococcus deserti]|uniref:Putative prepilin-like protein n=1 Tax=Deinococcus deserti (strain DSM 17065 / CIP 109153 / LMG 22923 / VCD115) TaxID=546414 RepID=C1CZZ8_DEIDV|nr:type II secretion system protein [Deinococcus deserti]ACO45250.1 putative prepilin-like protein [Deinococcus deserti VCD115]